MYLILREGVAEMHCFGVTRFFRDYGSPSYPIHFFVFVMYLYSQGGCCVRYRCVLECVRDTICGNVMRLLIASLYVYFAQTWSLSFSCWFLCSFRIRVLFASKLSIDIRWWSALFDQIAGVVSRKSLFAEEEVGWRGVEKVVLLLRISLLLRVWISSSCSRAWLNLCVLMFEIFNLCAFWVLIGFLSWIEAELQFRTNFVWKLLMLPWSS